MTRHAVALALGAVVAMPRGGFSQSPNGPPSGPLVAATFAFDAKATMGDFTGWTTKGTGELKGADDVSGVRGWVQLPAAALSTENGKRDGHLREHINSKKFPTIRLEVSGARQDSVRHDTTFVTLDAAFNIHGVTKSVTIPARTIWDAQSLHVWATFPLDIRDYGMPPPKKLMGIARMDPVVRIRVEAVFGQPPHS